MAVVLQPASPDAAGSWIEKTPGRCGGEPCVRDTRITVSGLVEYRRLGLSDAELLAAVGGLTPADLAAAWHYYAAHPDEIEAAIRENQEAPPVMARLLADEDFPLPAVIALRGLGHDVLRVQEAGLSGVSDPDVLTHATADNRAVLTHNRRDYIRLNQSQRPHGGIIVVSRDADSSALAARIDLALSANPDVADQLLRINRAS